MGSPLPTGSLWTVHQKRVFMRLILGTVGTSLALHARHQLNDKAFRSLCYFHLIYKIANQTINQLLLADMHFCISPHIAMRVGLYLQLL